MLYRLGRFTALRRRPILAIAAAAFVFAALGSAGVIDRLSSGGIESPGSESVRAFGTLERDFGVGRIDLVLLVTARDGDVDDAAATRAGRRLARRLAAEPGVAEVISYWTGRLPPLRGENGDKALILARVSGTRDDVTRRLDALIPRYELSDGPIIVRPTGFGAVFREISDQIERDLRRAERIVIPVTLVLLLIVFRSAIAALLPLVVGGLAMIGTLAMLRALASVTEVSVFALSMTLAMSLGLGIDYSLFVVSRFREELQAGHDVTDAIARTVATAGRTVAFSAITVAASLVALLVFPLAFLRSFGYAGIGVVAIAGFSSVVVLPALLSLIGMRIDRWSIRRPVPRPVGEGGWHRIAMTVMRRPVPIAMAAIALLVLLGLPFLRIELGAPDPRVLPPGSPARATVDDFGRNFSGGEAFPTFALVEGVDGVRPGQVGRYAAALSLVPGVARVDAATGSYAQGSRLFAGEGGNSFMRDDAMFVRIVPAPAVEPFSPRAERLLDQIRSVQAPRGGQVSLAGQTAEFFDGKDEILRRLPLALAMIGVATFVVLFLAFGSVLVPVKAIVLNLLSLTATFGAMVWVFQDGHLAGVLGFTPREAIDVFNPILMFAIAFGISMDYEVFMLSRIREEYDRTGDNVGSVATGLERTGRLITAAALLLVIVFLARVTSGVSIIKMYGLGMALAILVDAFVVRTTLVPAVMRLAGGLNWWAPRWMQGIYRRWGHHETYEPIRELVLDEPVEAVARAPRSGSAR